MGVNKFGRDLFSALISLNAIFGEGQTSKKYVSDAIDFDCQPVFKVHLGFLTSFQVDKDFHLDL